MSLDRIGQLERLLRPISSTGQRKSRQAIYRDRRRDVRLVYPFLTENEKARADDWLTRWEYRD